MAALRWNKQRGIQLLLVILYVCALIAPAAVFFYERGGLTFLQGSTPHLVLQLLFPLFGLYAFTFVAWQVLIGTNLWWLQRVWPKMIHFHRFQGSFSLLFATLHPLFILLGFGIMAELHLSYVTSAQKPYLLPGILALTILWVTVVTALLAWQGMKLPWWRRLHKLNYLVFPLVWLHSWFIGSDVPTSPLRFLWVLYLVAVALSVVGTYRRQLGFVSSPQKPHAS